jgi:hypothetical protein
MATRPVPVPTRDRLLFGFPSDLRIGLREAMQPQINGMHADEGYLDRDK